MASQFGRIVTGYDVEQAALETARTWMPSYIAEVADQAGLERTSMPNIRTYTTASDQTQFTEDALPCLVLICPGLYSQPTKSRGTYDAAFSVGGWLIVSGPNKQVTRRMMSLYVAAVRACFVQQQSLPSLNEDGEVVTGIADNIEWLDESYDEAPGEASRTLAAGQINLAITVKNVLDVSGISEPTIEPAPVVLVEQVFTEIRRKEIT